MTEDGMQEDTSETLPAPKADALQAFLKRAAFAGVVIMLLLVVFVAKFEFLQAESALEDADIARSIANGKGLRGLSLQPLNFALADDQAERVIYVPPLYPIVLAGGLRACGINDRAVALTSMVFLALTTGLAYLIALRFCDERTAVGAVALVVLTVPLLQHGVSGNEVAFLSFLVTGLFGLLLWWTRSENRASDWWPVGASAIVVACWLTRYEMAVLVPCLALFWLYSGRRRRWRRVLWTVVPFIAVAGLWTVRNSLLLDRPIVSPWAYYMLADTSLYPTTVILRLYKEFATHPWAVAFEHPGMMAEKFARNLRQLYYAIPMLGNPFVTAFFLVGVVMATARRQLALLHWCTLLAMALIVPVLCLYLRTPGLLVCFIPVVTILAVRELIQIVEGTIPPRARLEWDGAVRLSTRLRVWIGLIGPEADGSRLVVFGLLMMVLLAGYPLVDYLFVQPAPEPTPLVAAARALGDQGYQLVMSNVPDAVAWYGSVRAVEVPASSRQLAAMVQGGIRPDAIYLAPAPGALRMEFEGYERVERPGVVGILWEPVAGGGSSSAGTGE